MLCSPCTLGTLDISQKNVAGNLGQTKIKPKMALKRRRNSQEVRKPKDWNLTNVKKRVYIVRSNQVKRLCWVSKIYSKFSRANMCKHTLSRSLSNAQNGAVYLALVGSLSIPIFRQWLTIKPCDEKTI